LTQKKKTETGEQGRITQPGSPITGSAELQAAPAKGDNEHSHRRLQQAYQGFKRWLRIFLKDFRLRLYRARFIVEVVGLIVLGIYTYQAREANRIARNNAERELRAYVSLSETRPDWTSHLKKPTSDAGQVITLTNASPNSISSWYRLRLGISLKNGGRTPASAVASIGTYTVRDTGSPAPNLTCPTKAFAPVIKSRSVLAAEADYETDVPPLFLEEPLFHLINEQETKVLYANFCISYRDIFNKKRCTQHCVVFRPFPGVFGSCPHGNSMDECTADYGEDNQ
jgi:hypothetical protein